MKLISVLLFLFMASCASQPKQHTYLKYAGYMEGCVDTASTIIMQSNPDLTPRNIDRVALDTMCMELYLIKLETENIKPPMKRYDRNEMI